jgi:hypothetical protein
LRRFSRATIDFFAILFSLNPQFLSLRSKWNTQLGKQAATFFISIGRGNDTHFHTSHLVNLIVVNLGENQLFSQSQCIIATPIEGIR